MLRRLRHLFDHLIHRRRVEDELNEEVEAIFAMTVDRFVAEGMSLSAARRAARIEFEGVEEVKEKVRDGLVGSALLVFFQDARYAVACMHGPRSNKSKKRSATDWWVPLSWYSSRMRATPGAGSAGVPRSPSSRCLRWHWELA